MNIQPSHHNKGSKMGVLSERPTEMELMLKGYGLILAQFFYMMPDHPRVIAPPFIWQEYDLAPDYPRLFAFIEFWQDKIEARLHSVSFEHRKLIAPGEWRNVTGEYIYH